MNGNPRFINVIDGEFHKVKVSRNVLQPGVTNMIHNNMSDRKRNVPSSYEPSFIETSVRRQKPMTPVDINTGNDAVLPGDTLIPVPSGSEQVTDIEVGDIILASDDVLDNVANAHSQETQTEDVLTPRSPVINPPDLQVAMVPEESTEKLMTEIIEHLTPSHGATSINTNNQKSCKRPNKKSDKNKR